MEIWFFIDANVKIFHFSCIFEKIVGNVSIENFVSTFTSQIFRHDTTWSFNFQTHYRIWNHYMEFMNKKYFELCEYYRKKRKKSEICIFLTITFNVQNLSIFQSYRKIVKFKSIQFWMNFHVVNILVNKCWPVVNFDKSLFFRVRIFQWKWDEMLNWPPLWTMTLFDWCRAHKPINIWILNTY